MKVDTQSQLVSVYSYFEKISCQSGVVTLSLNLSSFAGKIGHIFQTKKIA